MLNRMLHIVVVVAASLTTACGGSEPAAQPVEPVTTAGDEEMQEAAEDVEEDTLTEPAQPASGPAQLTVVAKVGNASVSARVKVLGSDGAVMAEGETGTALTVQSGALTIEASITDAAIMIDTPTVRHDMEISAGDSRTEDVRFPRAQVRVTVNVNGKPDNKATVTLLRNGAVVATLTSGAPDFVSITPGRFSAKVKVRNAEIDIPDVMVPDDSSRNIPLNVTL